MTFDINTAVIIVEQDVEQPGTRRKRGVDMNDPKVKTLLSMGVGDSFFLADVTKKDVRPLLDLGKKVNVPLIARDVDLDEIYQKAGVRVWRIDESEVRTRRTKAQIEAEKQTLTVDKNTHSDPVRYWHHPESECVFRTGPGTGKGHPSGSDFDEAQMLMEIDEAEYIRLSAEYDDL
ncbi:hypothetical protein I4940_07985 [Pseudomonas aeruginosa]|nr:hypothetical protein [Pseudomonas aeruginosa]MBG7570821.1 hypothetical protein [Pseudomonas aeruginosa]